MDGVKVSPLLVFTIVSFCNSSLDQIIYLSSLLL